MSVEASKLHKEELRLYLASNMRASALRTHMYTAAARDRLLNPTRVGPLARATHCGRCGDRDSAPSIVIWLRFENGRVDEAAWSSNGCVAMIACASAVAELSEGKNASYLVHVSPEEVLEMIGPLPHGKEHVPDLALTALKDALEKEIEPQ